MVVKSKFLFSSNCSRELHLPLETLKESFIETLVWSALTDINIVVLQNCKIYNIEYTNWELINSNQWQYHYFIPTEKFNENIVFLGYTNDLNNFEFIKTELKPKTILYDIEKSINVFCKELHLTEIHYKNHSFKTVNEEYFANYLDLICFGWAGWLPSHWGQCAKYKKFSIDLYQNYSNFLEENHYKDSINASILFYNEIKKNKNL